MTRESEQHLFTTPWSGIRCEVGEVRIAAGRSIASDDADLFFELFHETLQTLMANLRQALAGDGLETVGEVQQFGLEVVEAKRVSL